MLTVRRFGSIGTSEYVVSLRLWVTITTPVPTKNLLRDEIRRLPALRGVLQVNVYLHNELPLN
jgi:hypothetical protein